MSSSDKKFFFVGTDSIAPGDFDDVDHLLSITKPEKKNRWAQFIREGGHVVTCIDPKTYRVIGVAILPPRKNPGTHIGQCMYSISEGLPQSDTEQVLRYMIQKIYDLILQDIDSYLRENDSVDVADMITKFLSEASTTDVVMTTRLNDVVQKVEKAISEEFPADHIALLREHLYGLVDAKNAFRNIG